MKKVILSVVVMFGLIGSTSAGGFSAAGLKINPILVPAVIMVAAAQVEYKACNDKPYVWVKREGTNFFTRVTQCK